MIEPPKFLTLGSLYPAERKLLRCAREGEWCWVATKRPDAKDRDGRRNVVRAALIRFLAMGGNGAHPIHSQGVMLSGAWIDGHLNCDSCHLTRPMWLQNCHFALAPVFRDAKAKMLSLQGSWVPSLNCQVMTTEGGVYLRKGFEAAGTVDLVGARIGGQLDCSDGKFLGKDVALEASGLRTEGEVFLSDGFEAAGMVNLRAAQIGGQLACVGGKFLGKDVALHADGLSTEGEVFLSKGFEAAGTVDLLGARIGGQLACSGGKFFGTDVALRIDQAKISGLIYLRDVTADGGLLNLVDAETAGIVDEAEGETPGAGSWQRFGAIRLDGFTYSRIYGPTDAKTRAAWLDLQRPEDKGAGFKPQPYEQLTKVLREMGHTEDARQIAITKQQKERRAALLQGRKRSKEAREARRVARDPETIESDRSTGGKIAADLDRVGRHFRWGLHRLFGLTVGYGYRPLYALYWLAGFVGVGAWVFAGAYAAEAMTPNDPFTLRSAEWTGCAGDPRGQVSCFLESTVEEGGRLDYPAFSAFWYALDTFVPFVNLHQEPRWIPDPARGGWGWWARLYLYAHIAIGWAITAVFAASVTGIVKKDV